MSFHLFDVREMFSSADGTIQFIELVNPTDDPNENFFQGQFLRVTSGNPVHQFSFPSNLPDGSTAFKTVLIATQGFADLGLVKPDYIIPDGFLFTDGGSVNFASVDTAVYSALPQDEHSVDDNGVVAIASPQNFAGATMAMPNFVEGGADDDNLFGGNGSDLVRGLAGDDTLSGGATGAVYDILDGGGGLDTALLNAPSFEVTAVSGTKDHLTVVASGRTTLFIDVERIQCSELTVAFDTNVGDHLWNFAALSMAGTGYLPSSAAMFSWLHEIDLYDSIGDLSNFFLDHTGANSVPAPDFVTYLYKTVLNINPSAEEVAAVTAFMGVGHLFETNGDLLAYVAVQSYNVDKLVDFTGSVQYVQMGDAF